MSDLVLKSLDVSNVRGTRGKVHVPLDAKVILIHGENGAAKRAWYRPSIRSCERALKAVKYRRGAEIVIDTHGGWVGAIYFLTRWVMSSVSGSIWPQGDTRPGALLSGHGGDPGGCRHLASR